MVNKNISDEDIERFLKEREKAVHTSGCKVAFAKEKIEKMEEELKQTTRGISFLL